MDITSNGSGRTESIEALRYLLVNSPLEPWTVFTMRNGQRWAWGNFRRVSHVFDITGTVEEMRELGRMIRNNKARNDWPEHDEAEAMATYSRMRAISEAVPA